MTEQPPSAQPPRPATAAVLHDSEERFRLLVESVQDYAIFLLDPDGHVASWNRGAERIKGYRAEEIIGQHFARFYPAEEVARGKPAWELEEAARVGRLEDEDWRVRRDGARFWANVVITALRDETGRLTGFAKVTRDLTERRRAEAERAELLALQRAEAVRAELLARERAALAEAERLREAFLASASHDLKTPLTGIRGLAQLARRRLARLSDPAATEAAALLAKADAAAVRLTRQLEELVAALGAPPDATLDLLRQVVDLVELAREAAAQVGDLTPHPIAVEAAVARAPVLGDPLHLGRVLDNLLANAIKFSPDGGEIAVRVAREDGAAGPQAVLAVRDHGLGIPAADLPHVFERFRRGGNVAGRIRGSGIGLASVWQIVDAHGGTVAVASEEGVGATVTVRLPLAPGGAGDAPIGRGAGA